MHEMNEDQSVSQFNEKIIENNNQPQQFDNNMNNLKIKERIEENLAINCVMNKSFLSSQNFSYKAYECFTCPGKLENICEFCFINCHKDHNSHLKGVVQSDKTVLVSKLPCDCAMQNHDFQVNNLSRSSSFEDTSMKCPINEVMSSIDPKYHFYEVKNQILLCFFCLENCYGHQHKEIVETLELGKEHNYCNIKKQETSSDLENTHSNTKSQSIYLISSSSMIEHPHCQCIKSEFHNCQSDNILNLSIMLNIKEIDYFYNKFKIPYQLLTSKNVLVSFITSIFVSTYQQHSKDSYLFNYNKTLESSQQLMRIMAGTFQKNSKSVFPGLEKCFNINKVLEILSDEEFSIEILKAKINLLQFFRIFIIDAKLGSGYHKYFGYNENTSAFHRLLLVKPHEANIRTNITTEQVSTLLKHVSKLITVNYEQIEEKLLVQVIREYLTYCNYFIMSYYNIEFLENICEDIGNYLKVIYVLKDSKLFNEVYHILEISLYNLALIKNDSLVYSELISKCKSQADLKKKLGFINPINLKDISFSTNQDLKKFVFEGDSAFNLNFARVCWVQCPESYDIDSYSKSNAILDLFVSAKDYYAEQIENQINTNYKVLSEELLYCFNGKSDQEMLENFIGIELGSKLTKSCADVRLFMTKLFESALFSEKKFLTQVLYKLEDIFSVIDLEFKHREWSNKSSKFLFQAALFKLGTFELMLDLLNMIERTEYLKKDVHNHMLIKSVDALLIGIVDLIIDENPFLTSLMFNRVVVKRMIRPGSVIALTDRITYYTSKINLMISSNYKINSVYLMNRMIKLSNDSCGFIDDDSNLVLVLECLMGLVKSSLPKTASALESAISNFMLALFANSRIEDLLNQLEASMQSMSVNRNQNDVDQKATIETALNSAFCLLNSIESSIIFLNPSVPVEAIIRVLGYYYELKPELRKTLFEIYSRFLLKDNFALNSNITAEYLNNNMSHLEINVIGNIVNKTKQNTSSEYKDFDFTAQNNGLNPIYEGLQMFVSIHKHFESNFTLKFLCDYFFSCIIQPALLTIYKLVYYPKMNAEIKYKIYKIVYLSSKNTSYFLEQVSRFSQAEMTELGIDVNPDSLKSFIKNIMTDIDLLNSSSFDHLNLKNLLKIFFNSVNVLNRFVINPKSDNDKSGEQNAENFFSNADICKSIMGYQSSNNDVCDKQADDESSETFYQLISELLDEYQEKKAEYYGKNIIDELLSDPSQENDNVKICIAMDSLLKLESDIDIKGNKLPFDYRNENALKIINKIFKSNPDYFQDVIKSHAKAKNYLDHLMKHQLTLFFQCISIGFLMQSPDPETNRFYNYFMDMIELIRLTCENHNKIYQTFLTNSFINSSLNLMSFMFSVNLIHLKHLEHFNSKIELASLFRVDCPDYFVPCCTQITNFLVEVIQGAVEYNFEKISQLEQFEEFCNETLKYFDMIYKWKVYVPILSEFMRFINCFLEENSNLSENKIVLCKRINMKKLQSILQFSFKRLYFKFCRAVEEEDTDDSLKKKETGSLLDQIESENILFSTYSIKENSSAELVNLYMKDSNLKESPFFTLGSAIYIMFKKSSNWRGIKSGKILQVLKENSLQELNPKDKNLQGTILKKETYLFYDKLIKEVEISFAIDDTIEDTVIKSFKPFFGTALREGYDMLYEGCKNKKNVLDNVVFLCHPDTLFTYDKDRVRFINNAPYDHFNEKLTFFLEFFDQFRNMISMRKILWESESVILNTLYSINYEILEVLSALLALFVNFLMLISINFKDTRNDEIVFTYEVMTHQISLVHNLILIFLILNWYFFKIYEMVRFTELKKRFIPKIFQFLSLFFHSEILPFLWILVWGMLGFNFQHLRFLYALQLFSIFNIVPTMSSVLFAVKIRYPQFASTAYLLVILIFLYSSITYYNFRNELLNPENGVSLFIIGL